MARWMGYGKEFQGLQDQCPYLGQARCSRYYRCTTQTSPDARNTIASLSRMTKCVAGSMQSLQLEKHVALVLDIHHHWIRDEEYIQADDDRVKRVIDSWRGVRPTLHYSYSRDEWLPEPSVLTQTTNMELCMTSIPYWM